MTQFLQANQGIDQVSELAKSQGIVRVKLVWLKCLVLTVFRSTIMAEYFDVNF